MLRRKSAEETSLKSVQQSTSISEPSVKKPKWTKKRVLLSVLAVAAVALMVFITVLVLNRGANEVSEEGGANDPRAGINTSADPKDLKDPIVVLKENQPAKGDSDKEKVAYYTKLGQLQGDNGDYKAAIASFVRGEQEAASAMSYEDYYIWAYYYERNGDNEAAVSKLRKALSMLPESQGSATSYSKQEMTNQINARIQRLSE